MKKLHCFLVVSFLALVTLQVTAQKTYVPDAKFRQALTGLGVGVVFVGDSAITATISAITTLDVPNKAINDLTGIEDFVALKELYCYANNLTSLDLSKNTALTILNCTNNQLASLDVTKNTALTTFRCLYNSLVTLDVSKNTSLTIFDCAYNQLEVIDVRNGNNDNITTFEASFNTNLSRILVDDRWAACLSTWVVPSVTQFWFNEGDSGLVFTYSPIYDDNFLQALKDLGHGINFIGYYVPTANIKDITALDVSRQHIADLSGISAFKALKELNCTYNDLTTLDVSQNTDLLYLYCDENQIITLNVSNIPDLTELGCSFNHIEVLNLSTNPDLQILLCNDNTIKILDLSTHTMLMNLQCYNNELTSLDLTKNPDLELVYCQNNELETLDLKNGRNNSITHFDASGNSNLTCIYVDDKTADLSAWTKDATTTYVNNADECNALPVTQISAEEFSYYPNPTNGIVNLDFSGKRIQNLKIVDVTGKIISEKNSLNLIETIDLSNFANGLYLMILQTENGTQSFKIVKE